jgi:uncharacterized membrane protein
MINYIILGAIAGLPILLILVLRASAAVVFLALCAVTDLLKFIGKDATTVLTSIWPHSNIIAQQSLNVSLLSVPPLVAIIRLRKTVSGSKMVLNIAPAVAVGLLAAISIVPLLSSGLRVNILHTPVWKLGEQMQGFIVGVGVLVSLLLLKGHRKKEAGHSKGHK